MPIPVDCCSPCSTPPPVNVIGSPGTPGTAGTDGVSAYATLGVALAAIPADGADTPTLTFSGPGSSPTAWMVVGQTVILGENGPSVLTNPGPYTFKVKSVSSPTGAVLTRVASSNDGTSISLDVGAVCSATGVAGATGIAGVAPTISTNTGLSQVITAVAAQVGAVACAIGVTNRTYLVLARVTLRWTGVTFAASRTVTVAVKNITQGLNLVTAARATEILTTTNLPDSEVVLPFLAYATGVAADILQLTIVIDVANSAGTFEVVEGSLALVPVVL